MWCKIWHLSENSTVIYALSCIRITKKQCRVEKRRNDNNRYTHTYTIYDTILCSILSSIATVVVVLFKKQKISLCLCKLHMRLDMISKHFFKFFFMRCGRGVIAFWGLLVTICMDIMIKCCPVIVCKLNIIFMGIIWLFC